MKTQNSPLDKTPKIPRRIRKILVEKKRRDRIDGCLKQIKELLFKGTEYQNEYMRMEKADILENVLKYIKYTSLQDKATNSSTTSSTTPELQSSLAYRKGYGQCMDEVTQVMDRICENRSTSHTLKQYMSNKINNMDMRQQCEASTSVCNFNGIGNRNIKQEESMLVSPPVVGGYQGNFSPIDVSRMAQYHPEQQQNSPLLLNPNFSSPQQMYNRNTMDFPVYRSYNRSSYSPISPISINTNYKEIKSEKLFLNKNCTSSINKETPRTSTPRSSSNRFQTLKVVPDSTSTCHAINDNCESEMKQFSRSETVKTDLVNSNENNNQNKNTWRPW